MRQSKCIECVVFVVIAAAGGLYASTRAHRYQVVNGYWKLIPGSQSKECIIETTPLGRRSKKKALLKPRSVAASYLHRLTPQLAR